MFKFKKNKFWKNKYIICQDICRLFHNCTELTSIDLSNFGASLVTDIGAMFAKYKSLTSIDASKFITQNVESMFDIWEECFIFAMI